jgi:hypothetical protein
MILQRMRYVIPRLRHDPVVAAAILANIYRTMQMHPHSVCLQSCCFLETLRSNNEQRPCDRQHPLHRAVIARIETLRLGAREPNVAGAKDVRSVRNVRKEAAVAVMRERARSGDETPVNEYAVRIEMHAVTVNADDDFQDTLRAVAFAHIEKAGVASESCERRGRACDDEVTTLRSTHRNTGAPIDAWRQACRVIDNDMRSD